MTYDEVTSLEVCLVQIVGHNHGNQLVRKSVAAAAVREAGAQDARNAATTLYDALRFAFGVGLGANIGAEALTTQKVTVITCHPDGAGVVVIRIANVAQLTGRRYWCR